MFSRRREQDNSDKAVRKIVAGLKNELAEIESELKQTGIGMARTMKLRTRREEIRDDIQDILRRQAERDCPQAEVALPHAHDEMAVA
ncbi:MAG: hypothetical protein KGI79_02120 [Patescibacteria group bacterium]|nr:hypothetical protein [Patescibacteria group bacterium]MDE2116647.1 hypothetical protein [Patescibacteria group bacterium]